MVMVGTHCLWRTLWSGHLAMRHFVRSATDSTAEDHWTSRELRIATPYGPLAAVEWTTPKSDPERNVLLLHGYLDNAASFDPLVPHLHPRWRAVALDFTGHGRSCHLPPGCTYTLYQFPMDVKRVVEHLGWKKFALVGHSMGGHVAHHYAFLFPDEVQKLGILDGFCPMYVAPKRAAKTLRSTMLEQLRLETRDASQRSSHTEEEVLRLYAEASLVPYRPSDVMCLMKRGCRRREDGRYVLTYDVRLRALFWPRIEWKAMCVSVQQYQNEMLVVRALPGLGFTPIHSREFANVCKASCSRFDMVVVEGNHHIHMNRPEEVAKHLQRLLDA